MIERNDIVGLSHHSFSTAAALAVAGVPPQRVKEWLKRGVLDITDPGGRGTGNRRRFQLLDVLRIRLTAALTDDDTGLSLSLGAARAILRSAYAGYERAEALRRILNADCLVAWRSPCGAWFAELRCEAAALECAESALADGPALLLPLRALTADVLGNLRH
jgi:DNA-binding transcriptional MerR regulator